MQATGSRSGQGQGQGQGQGIICGGPADDSDNVIAARAAARVPIGGNPDGASGAASTRPDASSQGITDTSKGVHVFWGSGSPPGACAACRHVCCCLLNLSRALDGEHLRLQRGEYLLLLMRRALTSRTTFCPLPGEWPGAAWVSVAGLPCLRTHEKLCSWQRGHEERVVPEDEPARHGPSACGQVRCGSSWCRGH